jgi:predicted transglutaminase-like cysteine proteinase
MRIKRWRRACAWADVGRVGLVLALMATFLQSNLSTTAQARGSGARGGPSLSAGSTVRPTRAWAEFCQERPDECRVDLSEPSTIALDPSTWRMIVSINRQVNEAIVPLSDRQHWGVEDRWDYPADGVGDCEDIQLVKRKRLIDAGLPRRALRMTVVIDEAGEGHAVLMARTSQGDFILDNKHNSVLPWDRTGYVFVMREGDQSAAWVSLGRRSSPTATANR